MGKLTGVFDNLHGKELNSWNRFLWKDICGNRNLGWRWSMTYTENKQIMEINSMENYAQSNTTKNGKHEILNLFHGK